MKLILGASLALVTVFAHAAEKVDIPIEVVDVQRVQDHQTGWSEFRGVEHARAGDVIARGEKSGGACHELPAERIVVCYFAGGRSVGIDWKKLNEDLNAKRG